MYVRETGKESKEKQGTLRWRFVDASRIASSLPRAITDAILLFFSTVRNAERVLFRERLFLSLNRVFSAPGFPRPIIKPTNISKQIVWSRIVPLVP